MINAMGRGWTLRSEAISVSTPQILWVVYFQGNGKWREGERDEKEKKKGAQELGKKSVDESGGNI